jgi:flagellar biosynthesis protein FlhB
MSGDAADRVHPPSPARREQHVARGRGPRAAWLASLLGAIIFAVMAAAAMPACIRSLQSMMRRLLDPAPTGSPLDLLTDALSLPLWLTAGTLAAAVLAHAAAHGAWIRMGPWRTRPRSSIASRLGPWLAALMAALAATAAGLACAWPWFTRIASWSDASLNAVAWSSLGVIASASLGAAAILAPAALLQKWRARGAFEAGIRLTRAEAKEAARESGEDKSLRSRRMERRP